MIQNTISLLFIICLIGNIHSESTTLKMGFGSDITREGVTNGQSKGNAVTPLSASDEPVELPVMGASQAAVFDPNTQDVPEPSLAGVGQTTLSTASLHYTSPAIMLECMQNPDSDDCKVLQIFILIWGRPYFSKAVGDKFFVSLANRDFAKLKIILTKHDVFEIRTNYRKFCSRELNIATESRLMKELKSGTITKDELFEEMRSCDYR